MTPPPERDLARLEEENRALGEQVKRLVRAERRLALSRHDQDRQLQNVKALNRFALDAGRADDVSDILRHALDLLLATFAFEQGIAFLGSGDGVMEARELRAVPGLEPAPGHGRDRLQPVPAGGAWPAGVRVADEAALRASEPGLGPFLDRFEPAFGRPAADAGEPAMVLVLPVRLHGHEQRALLVLRRVTPLLSLLEHLPDETDLPFVQLVGAHAAVAIENLASFHEAREAVRARDEFLSIASHELRTPLTALLMLVQALRRRASPDELGARWLATVERQAHRLAGLIDQLLDVSRIRVGRLAPEPVRVDLPRLVRDVVESLAEDLRRSGCPLLLCLPEALPVHADPAQLERVVANLLTNAMKFGARGPIEVVVRASDGRATVEVADRGIGISEDDQRRIFDRFERAVSSRNFGGLGLGLYITRQIVEAHGGTIAVTSRPGEKTTFRIELPRG